MAKVSAQPSDLEQLAITVAEQAGAVLLGYARRLGEGADLAVGAKTSMTDPVSDADRETERLIAGLVLDARPDDGYLGEEGLAGRTGSSGLRWVVDPLDGTVNFLRGLDAWSVSVAVEDEHGVIAGVVHQPMTSRTYHAARGHGAYLAGRRLAVSEVAGLSDILLATGFSYQPSVRTDQSRDMAALLPAIRDLRRAGSAALDLAECAAGRTDAYLEFGLSPWDWAAGRLLVTEAGGRLTTPERLLGGQRLSGLVGGSPIATDALTAWLDATPPGGPPPSSSAPVSQR